MRNWKFGGLSVVAGLLSSGGRFSETKERFSQEQTSFKNKSVDNYLYFMHLKPSRRRLCESHINFSLASGGSSLLSHTHTNHPLSLLLFHH